MTSKQIGSAPSAETITEKVAKLGRLSAEIEVALREYIFPGAAIPRPDHLWDLDVDDRTVERARKAKDAAVHVYNRVATIRNEQRKCRPDTKIS